MANFTAGPWRIGNLPSWDGYTGKPFRNVWAGDEDAAVCIARAIDHGDVDANAALIAAAPDLLAACLALTKYATVGQDLPGWVIQAHEQAADAVRKATVPPP